MQIDPAVWAVVILGGALIGVLGALTGQLIGTRASLKKARLELSFKARAESYPELMERMGEYALDPSDHNYLALGSSYMKAVIFASDEVYKALEEFNIALRGLRTAVAEEELDEAGFEYNIAAGRVTDEMRSELMEKQEPSFWKRLLYWTRFPLRLLRGRK